MVLIQDVCCCIGIHGKAHSENSEQIHDQGIREKSNLQVLGNLGNTCYYNAVMQNILNTKSFVDLLLQRAEKDSSPSNGIQSIQGNRFEQKPITTQPGVPLTSHTRSQSGELTGETIKLFRHARSEPESDAFVSSYLSVLDLTSRLAGFVKSRQEDSHELFRYFLMNMKDEELTSAAESIGTRQKYNTVVDEVFGITINTITVCKVCMECKVATDKNVDLTLSLSNTCSGSLTRQDVIALSKIADWQSGAKQEEAQALSSVESCLQRFIEPTTLIGEDEYRCDNCTHKEYIKQGSTGEKNYVYTEAYERKLIGQPPKVLVLHLNRFREISTGMVKDDSRVIFPLELNLAPFCSNRYESPEASRYFLYGTIQHKGDLQGGHYTAFIKSGKWYHVDDHIRTQVTDQDVLKSEAFMLFYQREHVNKF